MTFQPQNFTAPDGTEMVIIPRAHYEALLEAAEDADDLAAAYAARRSAETEGTIPAEVSRDVRAGRNPVAAWRRHRGMSQAELASRAGITQAAVARIESAPAGSGRPATLESLAAALGAPIAYLRADHASAPNSAPGAD